MPARQFHCDEAKHGRVLALAEELSLRWGAYRVGSGGKVIWCSVGQPDD